MKNTEQLRRGLPPQTRKLTHIYVRNRAQNAIRPCWTLGGKLYCGVCLQGELRAELGAACPVCSSTVERIPESVKLAETTERRPSQEAPNAAHEAACDDPRAS